MSALYNEDRILELIPQRPPMTMISSLVLCDEKVTRTTFFIKDSNIFCEEGRLTEPGLIENIAQTAAARVGYICKIENKPVPVGFIGAIKDLKIHSLPQVNSTIETEVTVVTEVMDITLIAGKITCNSNVIAECQMKIFIKKD